MDENTKGLMTKQFDEYFVGYCEEHATTYDEPECMVDQISDAFDAGFPSKEALFSYVRHMPETDRENFLRLQLKFKPVPGIHVQGGSLETPVGVPKMVAEPSLMTAAFGFECTHNNVDHPSHRLEYVVVRPISVKDPTKGYRAVSRDIDTGEEIILAEFTYGRLLVYVAVGMLQFAANNYEAEADPNGSLPEEPAELLSRYLSLVHGDGGDG